MRRGTMCDETRESLVCEYDYETLARSPTGNHILLSPFLSGGMMLQLLLHRRCTARTSDPTSLPNPVRLWLSSRVHENGTT